MFRNSDDTGKHETNSLIKSEEDTSSSDSEEHTVNDVSHNETQSKDNQIHTVPTDVTHQQKVSQVDSSKTMRCVKLKTRIYKHSLSTKPTIKCKGEVQSLFKLKEKKVTRYEFKDGNFFSEKISSIIPLEIYRNDHSSKSSDYYALAFPKSHHQIKELLFIEMDTSESKTTEKSLLLIIVSTCGACLYITPTSFLQKYSTLNTKTDDVDPTLNINDDEPLIGNLDMLVIHSISLEAFLCRMGFNFMETFSGTQHAKDDISKSNVILCREYLQTGVNGQLDPKKEIKIHRDTDMTLDIVKDSFRITHVTWLLQLYCINEEFVNKFFGAVEDETRLQCSKDRTTDFLSIAYWAINKYKRDCTNRYSDTSDDSDTSDADENKNDYPKKKKEVYNIGISDTYYRDDEDDESSTSSTESEKDSYGKEKNQSDNTSNTEPIKPKKMEEIQNNCSLVLFDLKTVGKDLVINILSLIHKHTHRICMDYPFLKYLKTVKLSGLSPQRAFRDNLSKVKSEQSDTLNNSQCTNISQTTTTTMTTTSLHPNTVTSTTGQSNLHFLSADKKSQICKDVRERECSRGYCTANSNLTPRTVYATWVEKNIPLSMSCNNSQIPAKLLQKSKTYTVTRFPLPKLEPKTKKPTLPNENGNHMEELSDFQERKLKYSQIKMTGEEIMVTIIPKTLYTWNI